MKGRYIDFKNSHLDDYLKRVWEYPILSRADERQLISDFHQNNDSKAADKLITSHLKLVVKIAMGSKGYGLPVADLISEGSIGLLKALEKFDPAVGARLSTYATWWIKATVNDYILKNWSMVPLGTVNAQRRLFFSLKRIKRDLAIYENHHLSDEQALKIAQKSDTSIAEVHHINTRLQSKDSSLNMPLVLEGNIEHQDQLQCERKTQDIQHAEEQERSLRKEIFSEALQHLQDRDREIIHARYLLEDRMPLKELGKRYGISSERVRQIEVKAIETIQSFIERHSLFSQLCLS